MGRTYSVPRNVKGETRLLYIFSTKSLIFTIIGAACGIPLFLILSKLISTIVGIIAVFICAAIGYGIGVLKVPDSPMFGNLRKAGGENVSDILIRTITFQKRKKIYIYRYSPKEALKTQVNKKIEESENTEKNENIEGEKNDDNSQKESEVI